MPAWWVPWTAYAICSSWLLVACSWMRGPPRDTDKDRARSPNFANFPGSIELVAPSPRNLVLICFPLSNTLPTLVTTFSAMLPPGMKLLQIGAVLTATFNTPLVSRFSFLNRPMIAQSPRLLALYGSLDRERHLPVVIPVGEPGFSHSLSSCPVIEAVVQVADVRSNCAEEIVETLALAEPREKNRHSCHAQEINPESRTQDRLNRDNTRWMFQPRRISDSDSQIRSGGGCGVGLTEGFSVAVGRLGAF